MAKYGLIAPGTRRFWNSKKKIKELTVRTWEQNHEIWRKCNPCGEFWDAKKEGLNCPKCGSKGTI